MQKGGSKIKSMNKDLGQIAVDADGDNKIKSEDSKSSRESQSFQALPPPNSYPFSKENIKRISKIPKSYRYKGYNPTRLIAALILILVIGFGGGWLGANAHDNSLDIVSSSSQAKEIISNQNELTAAIVKSLDPSVVSVDATATTTTQDIFGQTQSGQEESEGTGIILSRSGYIITNRHVIPSGTTSVSITLSDGTTINNVKIVGETADSDSLDLAFLKVDNSPEALKPALLGNSGNMDVGDNVVAIGNALGQFQNTVTSGIISGRGRTITAGDSTGTDSEDLQDLFQTDAAINEGNSGGPLININGEVIGINTAVASTSTAQNIGFAIPINDALGMIKGVLSTGKVERPYLGVYYESINPTIANKNNLSVTEGAYVPQDQNGQASIISGSPASNAGLQAGDVITAVNGIKIDDNNSLSSLIDENQVGSKISLTVIRNHNQLPPMTVTVGEDPGN
jgi:serine protease Do